MEKKKIIFDEEPYNAKEDTKEILDIVDAEETIAVANPASISLFSKIVMSLRSSVNLSTSVNNGNALST